MVELSANLYGSWGSSFGDVINMTQHKAVLNFWLWVWQRSMEAEQTVVLETVIDEREATETVKPHCFRLWVPLDSAGITAFATRCAGALPVWTEPRPKRARPAPLPTLGGRVLQTRTEVMEALRAFYGGIALADVSTSPAIPGRRCPRTTSSMCWMRWRSWCQQVSARASRSGSGTTCRTLRPDNGRTSRLQFPPEAIAKGLVREIRPSFFQHADDILNYHLPHLMPTASKWSR